ncbi:MAG: DUF4091 domain-containing protein [Prevotellaceae bacterium]|jgi:hypothetical protein|nr:DUF4091 domain-containing protein [Prevotellaceae bacterium]
MTGIAKILLLTCIIGLAALTTAYAQPGAKRGETSASSKAAQRAWSKVKKPLCVSFVSKDIRFSKTEVPDVAEEIFWGETCWRGERIGAQLLLWSGTGASDVALHVSDLETSAGQKISAKCCTAGFMRYVMSDEFGADGCSPRQSARLDSAPVADAIEYRPTVSIRRRTVQPVWFSLNVQPETPAGKYKGFITVTARELPDPVTLTINVFVRNHLLPPAPQWSFYLDMWQNPIAVARRHNLTPWSKAHFNAMRPAMAQLAQCGQKAITIPLTDNAIEGALPNEYESMVTLTRRVDNTWSADFTKLDLWVEFMMSLGVNRELSCYVSSRSVQTFSYFDQASNSIKVQEMSAGSREHGEYLKSLLELLTAHLKAKGWLDQTAICLQEAGKERLRRLIDLVAKVDSGYSISYTGRYFADVRRSVSRYSVAPKPFAASARRDADGRENRLLCIYSPCSDAQPGTYTFSPPAEAAWLCWYAAANGLDGYTRQAYNSWGKNPLQDARSASRAAGFYAMAYPNGASSLRMERLLEGIQDYEKVKILLRDFNGVNNVINREKLQKTLRSFTLESLKSKPAGQTVEEARIILNSL